MSFIGEKGKNYKIQKKILIERMIEKEEFNLIIASHNITNLLNRK